jgi:hypothetical protein
MEEVGAVAKGLSVLFVEFVEFIEFVEFFGFVEFGGFVGFVEFVGLRKTARGTWLVARGKSTGWVRRASSWGSLSSLGSLGSLGSLSSLGFDG